MTFDPFADNTPVNPAPSENDWPGVDDEAQTNLAFPTREAAVTQIQNQNDKLSVTLKYEGGFDQPWVVLKATSVEEMNELLAEAGKSGLLEAVAKTAAYTKNLGKPQNAPAQRPAQQGGYRQGQPQASTQGPNGQPPVCAHGPMKYASGINKQNRPYSAYFCTLKTQNWQEKCPKVDA